MGRSKLIIAYSASMLIFGLVTTCSSASTDVRSVDPNGLSLSYRPVCSYIDTVQTNGKSYSLFSYDGHSINASPGMPQIPSTSIFFASPSGTIPGVDISGFSWSERSGVILAPRPVQTDDGSGFANDVYMEDQQAYALSGFRPSAYWNLNKSSEINGYTIWELELRPMLFDASAGKIAVADSFDVRVTIHTSAVAKRAGAVRLPDYIINRNVFSGTAVFGNIRKTAQTDIDPFSSGDWYRIKLAKTGIYSITGQELSQAGFPVGTAKTEQIRMYYGGGKTLAQNPLKTVHDSFREIAITVDDGGDGTFGMNDKIIFYGSALSRFIIDQEDEKPIYQNHPYSEQNVYWLTISREGTPKRIQNSGEQPSDALAAITAYPEFLHIEPENHIDYDESGIEWYWEEISNSSKTFAINAPGLVSSNGARMKIMFLNQAVKLAHTVDVYLNNDGPYSFIFNSGEFLTADITSVNSLKQSNNLLKIVRTINKSSEFIRLDWVEVEYMKHLEYRSGTFDFFVSGKGSPMKFSISDVNKSTLKIFNTTDPWQISEVSGQVYDTQGKTLTFQTFVPEENFARFTVCDPASYLKVDSVAKKSLRFPSLRNGTNGADYIVIAPNKFMDEARKLANWRAQDSHIDPLTSMAVDLNDVFDEFAWGVFDPVAIRDFLKYAWDEYTPHVRYCCLIGDAIWKFKNLDEKQKESNLMPTMFHIDDHDCVATDDFFTWFDTNTLPYIATGRLCASTVESAKAVVDKIIEYERNPEKGYWHNRMLFVGDDELGANGIGHETVYSINTEQIDRGDYIPQSIERTKLMEIEYPLKNLRKPEATEDLITAINDGYLLMNYIGHGNIELLAHEHILEGSRDMGRLNNGPRQSVFFIASCSVGHFDRIENISLAEMLNLRREGGCLAVIAGSRNTYNYTNVNLNKSFYHNLFERNKNPDYRIGEALKYAKIANYRDSNANRYHIFGDPGTRLMIPRNSFAIAGIDSVYRLQKLTLSGNVTDETGPVPYTGTLFVKARGPMAHKIYTTLSGSTISYTMPGRTFYNGRVGISGNGFETEFIIPKDLTPTGDDSRIFFFSTGGTEEASGILENFIIGGIDADAPDDIAGPEIILTFDSKKVEDGDFIGRQPALIATVTDPSGINIYGNRGHNISLMINNTEMVILTEKFQNINTFTTGILDYNFPILSPGEHTIELSVYDTYNNIAKKKIVASVVGTEQGTIVIQNLLNYPNPMDSDGTWFTFNLNDDAGSAEIKLFSQSGRMVDSFSFSAGYGFNTFFWKPAFDLANGVYFYKLTVRSVNGRKSSKIEKLVVMR